MPSELSDIRITGLWPVHFRCSGVAEIRVFRLAGKLLGASQRKARFTIDPNVCKLHEGAQCLPSAGRTSLAS